MGVRFHARARMFYGGRAEFRRPGARRETPAPPAPGAPIMADVTGGTTNPQLLREVADPENNEAAWRTFLERYQPLIHAWCCRSRLRPDQSEEVTGRVLAKLVTAMRTKYTHDPACRFRGWLRTVVQNEVNTFWREQVRRP